LVGQPTVLLAAGGCNWQIDTDLSFSSLGDAMILFFDASLRIQCFSWSKVLATVFSGTLFSYH